MQDKQIEKMRIMLLEDKDDNSKDEIFKSLLEDAEAIALDTLFPFQRDKKILDINDIRLMNWKVRCAIELYNRIGSENIETYSENGLSVTYKAGLISSHLMNELVPRAGVIK